jgi:hypothetical protein
MRKHSIRRHSFKSDRLQLLASSEEFQSRHEPPLRLGDVVRLNSGGPVCLVVDLPNINDVTVSWRDSRELAVECTLPRPCLHSERFAG